MRQGLIIGGKGEACGVVDAVAYTHHGGVLYCNLNFADYMHVTYEASLHYQYLS
jgi:hypothetical protein